MRAPDRHLVEVGGLARAYVGAMMRYLCTLHAVDFESLFDFECRYLKGHVVDRDQDGRMQQEAAMLKLKDWPPSADIREKLCRHYAVRAHRLVNA